MSLKKHEQNDPIWLLIEPSAIEDLFHSGNGKVCAGRSRYSLGTRLCPHCAR